jgi:hypothetical protein
MIMRDLTQTEQTIVDFADNNKDLTWESIEFVKDKRIEFYRVCKIADVDELPEYQSDMNEEFFNHAKEALLFMADGVIEGILEEEEMELQKKAIEAALTETETSNNNNFVATEVAEGEDNMKTTTTNSNKVSENAKAFAEAAQEKVESAAKYAINTVSSVKDVVKDVASMKTDDLEDYLKDNAQTLWETIKEKISNHKDKLNRMKDIIPEAEEEARRFDNILNTFSEILDDEELNGWGKFKEIVKELVKWIVRIFLKVGAILLKIAVTIVVGTVKIGAVAIDTTFGVAGIVGRDVVKPTFNSAKTAYNNHKVRKAEKKAMEEDFDDYDDMVEETADEM